MDMKLLTAGIAPQTHQSAEFGHRAEPSPDYIRKRLFQLPAKPLCPFFQNGIFPEQEHGERHEFLHPDPPFHPHFPYLFFAFPVKIRKKARRLHRFGKIPSDSGFFHAFRTKCLQSAKIQKQRPFLHLFGKPGNLPFRFWIPDRFLFRSDGSFPIRVNHVLFPEGKNLQGHPVNGAYPHPGQMVPGAQIGKTVPLPVLPPAFRA